MIHNKEYACVKWGNAWYENSKPHVEYQWHVSYGMILCSLQSLLGPKDSHSLFSKAT